MEFSYIDSTPKYAPGHQTVEQIFATSNWLQNVLSKAFEDFDVTLSQFNVMRVLYFAKPDRLTCSEIGNRLIDKTPDVTRLLDRLEKHEYVDRKRARHDRRLVEVGLTETGERMLEKLHPILDDVIDRITESLSNVEHHLLAEYLERFRAETSTS